MPACSHQGCNIKRAEFNFSNASIGIKCRIHKEDGMVNVCRSRRNNVAITDVTISSSVTSAQQESITPQQSLASRQIRSYRIRQSTSNVYNRMIATDSNHSLRAQDSYYQSTFDGYDAITNNVAIQHLSTHDASRESYNDVMQMSQNIPIQENMIRVEGVYQAVYFHNSALRRPYDQQNQIIGKICSFVSSTQKQCLIDAPTGIGKTRAVLSALVHCLNHSLRNIHKVYYLLRTHTQMEQVARELENAVKGFHKKQVYSVHVASRSKLCNMRQTFSRTLGTAYSDSKLSSYCKCINESTSRKKRDQPQANITLIDNNQEDEYDPVDEPISQYELQCVTSLRQNNKCPYFFVDETFHNQSLTTEESSRSISIVDDIEDIYKPAVSTLQKVTNWGNIKNKCSYFKQRYLVGECEIVIMPYISFCTDNSFVKHKHDLVIVDEAHNLPDSITNSLSFSVKYKQLSELIIDQLRSNVYHYISMSIQQNPPLMQNIFILKAHEEWIDASIQSIIGLSLGEWKRSMSRLKQTLDNASRITCNFAIQERNYINQFNSIIQSLPVINICSRDHSHIDSSVDASGNSSLDASGNSSLDAYGNYFQQQFLRIVAQYKKQFEQDLLHQLQIQPSTMDIASYVPNTKVKNKVDLLSFIMKDLNMLNKLNNRLFSYKQNIQDYIVSIVEDNSHPIKQYYFECEYINSIDQFKKKFLHCQTILLSGTLQPVFMFKAQLGIHPSVSQLETDHVIEPQQLWIHKHLQQRYTSTELNKNIQNCAKHAARVIQLYSNYVKGGIIVFAPSKGKLHRLIKQWERDNLYTNMIRKRHVLLDDGNLGNTIHTKWQEYSQKCQENCGAIMFTYVGGSFSEGFDTRDEMSRCVVIVGYPEMIPRKKDKTFEMLQREYMKMNGTQWPCTKEVMNRAITMRKINQTIGRAIRHSRDYGIVALVDGRYDENDEYLPQWLQSNLQNYGNLAQQIITGESIVAWQHSMESMYPTDTIELVRK